jgi:thiamine-phosphate pyrophosphorylase
MEAAIKEGVDMVQVREKEMTAAELFDWGGKVLELGRRLEVPVLINDSVEVAHALDADGVHLGQDDLPAA